MVLPDVNILVYAYRSDAVDHERYTAWLERTINDDAAYGLADHVLSGFLRVVTHPRVFNPPSSLEQALTFVSALRSRANCFQVTPGPRHWELFISMCHRAGAKGN